MDPYSSPSFQKEQAAHGTFPGPIRVCHTSTLTSHVLILGLAGSPRRGPVLGGPLCDILVLDVRSVELYQDVH
jgi:hypothetical protein